MNALSYFFQDQADYLVFLHGLTFILLALICRSLQRQTERVLPWKWLGFFALTHGVGTWLDLLVINNEKNTIYYLVCLGIETLSFMFLVEFGRASTTVNGKRLGRWIFIPLLLLIVLGTFGRLLGISISHDILGLVGGLWAAWVLLRTSIKQRLGRGYLAAAGVGIALHAMTLVVAASHGSFVYTQTQNKHLFPLIIGVPAQLVWTSLGLLIVLALWGYSQELGAIYDKDYKMKALYTRRVILALLVVLTIGWMATEMEGHSADLEMRDSLLSQTKMIAVTINHEHIADLSGTSADIGTPSYERLKRQLTDIRQAASGMRFVYLMALKNNDVVFLVDSEPPESKDYSPPGQVYSEASPELIELLGAGRSFVEGPFTDRWGVWVSGLVAIRDPETNQSLAVLGMDVDARDWDSSIYNRRLLAIVVIMFIAGVIILSAGLFISYRNLKETSLQALASEKRYQSLAETSPNFVAIFDEEGRCLSINRYGTTLIGMSEIQILGKKFTDIWPDEYYTIVDNTILQALRGEHVKFEAEYTRPDGQTLSLRAILNPITDKDGKIRRFLGVLTDVTKRRHIEGALHESERRFSDTLENIKLAAVILDLHGTIVSCNRFLLELTGWEHEDVLRRNWFEKFLPADVWNTVEPMFLEKIMSGNIPTHYEYDILTREGERRTLLWSNTILRDAQENAVGILSIGEDITERKKAEKALQESEERYRGLYESIKEGIVRADMEGRILDVNQAYADMLGYTKEEVKKLTYQQITPQKWHAVEEDIIRNKILKIGYSDVYGKEYIKKDGTVFPIELRVWLIKDEQGRPIGMWAIVRDITKRKSEEDGRKRAEEEIKHLASFPHMNPNPILEVNSAGKITFHNHAVTEAMKKLGVEDKNVFMPEDISEILKVLGQKKKTQFYREVKIKDRLFAENICLTPEFNAVRIYAVDVTDIKQAK